MAGSRATVDASASAATPMPAPPGASASGTRERPTNRAPPQHAHRPRATGCAGALARPVPRRSRRAYGAPPDAPSLMWPGLRRRSRVRSGRSTGQAHDPAGTTPTNRTRLGMRCRRRGDVLGPQGPQIRDGRPGQAAQPTRLSGHRLVEHLAGVPAVAEGPTGVRGLLEVLAQGRQRLPRAVVPHRRGPAPRRSPPVRRRCSREVDRAGEARGQAGVGGQERPISPRSRRRSPRPRRGGPPSA